MQHARGRKGMHTEVRAENLKERDHREDRCRGGGLVLKLISEK
jgi:hypothetical protein